MRSSVLWIFDESLGGDCDRVLFCADKDVSVGGNGDDEVIGIGSPLVIDDGDCVLKRVLDREAGGVIGAKGGIAEPPELVPLLEDGELDADSGC